MNKKIAAIRQEYCLKELTRDSVNDDPLLQFEKWLDEALTAEVNYPTAMTLATAGTDGHPSARVVLLKDLNRQGLSFFTNYESDKGRQLNENPHAALVFFWPELERQVRFEGITEKLPSFESDEYFLSRPADSKTSAWASRQSTRINSRGELETEVIKIINRFKDKDITRPPFWGGYRLLPIRVEFWQGRISRLHDRILYLLQNERWEISRLSP
jgi:pyridoxamine 5'-phosphate oxidase